MNCEQCKELLVAYVEDLLAESQKQAIESHLKSCPPCRAEADQIVGLRERLAANGKTLAQSDLENKVLNRILREQSSKLREVSKSNKQIQLWRIIMKNRITKTAAAVIIIALLVPLSYGTVGIVDETVSIVQRVVHRGEQISEVLEDLPFSLPRGLADVQIEVQQARGEVFIAELPSEENDYELVVTFDDDKAGGPDWYEVVLRVTPVGGGTTGQFSIYIKAFIDGVSNLVFKDNTVYWHHLKWAVPGRHGGHNYPTYINDVDWIPEWPKVADTSYRGEHTSEFLRDLPFLLPRGPADVQIEVQQARGQVFIAELPSEENDYELVVTFDDDKASGPNWYEAVVHVTPTGGWTTEPFSIYIKAFIDGVSSLLFKDKTVYWHHLKWAAPGRHGGHNHPTYINDIEWIPEWLERPSRIDDTTYSHQLNERMSGVLEDLAFSLPRGPADIQIEVQQARGEVFVADLPSEENDYELVVTFDDDKASGPNWYEVVVHVTPTTGWTTEQFSIHIKAFIDGVSNLVFKDNTVYWHHLKWAAPGRHGGHNYPTYINDIEWIPQWPQAKEPVEGTTRIVPDQGTLEAAEIVARAEVILRVRPSDDQSRWEVAKVLYGGVTESVEEYILKRPRLEEVTDDKERILIVGDNFIHMTRTAEELEEVEREILEVIESGEHL